METVKPKTKWSYTYVISWFIIAGVALVFGMKYSLPSFPAMFLTGSIYGAAFMAGTLLAFKSHTPKDCDKYDWGDKK